MLQITFFTSHLMKTNSENVFTFRNLEKHGSCYQAELCRNNFQINKLRINSKWRISIHNLPQNIIYRKIYRNIIYHDKYAGIFRDSFGFIRSKLYTPPDCCLKIKWGFSFQKSKSGAKNVPVVYMSQKTILIGLRLITWQKRKARWWCYVLQIRTS